MRNACPRGFTLVELLVALAVMAVLTGLAWRGLDGMLRSRDVSQQAVERAARLNTLLAQWQQDLAALQDTGAVPALAFDGQTLRLTRSTRDGIVLVAWQMRAPVWQRWASAPVTRAGALQEAWLRSQQLLGNEAGQVTLLDDAEAWQVYFWRGGGWSNPQSTGNLAENPGARLQTNPGALPREELPEGVRLVLTVAGGGTLTRDLVVAPQKP